jgi:nucleoside triphosphate diphosphatase
VFSDGQIEGTSDQKASVHDVKRTWEQIKQRERNARNKSGALADIPLALPALSRAQKVQKRAAQLNFDWTDTLAVVDKLQEELDELRQAISGQANGSIADEMGDVLFTCVNLARHLGHDAEKRLRAATRKFEQRFGIMESLAIESGIELSTLDEHRFDDLWRQAKERLVDDWPGL